MMIAAGISCIIYNFVHHRSSWSRFHVKIFLLPSPSRLNTSNLLDLPDINDWLSGYLANFLDVRLKLCKSLLILDYHVIQLFIEIILSDVFKTSKEVILRLSAKESCTSLRTGLINWTLNGFKMSILNFPFKLLISSSAFKLLNVIFKFTDLYN